MCVVRGSARGAFRDGEGVRLVVLGSGEGDVAVSARRAVRRGCDQDGLFEAEGEPRRCAGVVAGERVCLEELVVKGDPGHRARCRGGEERRGRGVALLGEVALVKAVVDARVF